MFWDKVELCRSKIDKFKAIFWKIYDLLLKTLFTQNNIEEKKISVESFFLKVAQFEFILSIYFCFSFCRDWTTFRKTDKLSAKDQLLSTILFMQGDQSDLHTVAALDKSDVPDLPAGLWNYCSRSLFIQVWRFGGVHYLGKKRTN